MNEPEHDVETPSMWVMLGLLLAVFILMAVVVMIAFTSMNLSMATHRVGARGASGVSGISGTSGFPGGTAAPGARGAPGPSGASGSISGPSGLSGIPGKQGPSGTPSTTSGPQGVSGFSGPEGDRGASGFLNFPVMVRTFAARVPGSFDQSSGAPLYPYNPFNTLDNWMYQQVEQGTGRIYAWVGAPLIWSEFNSSNANIVTTAPYPASSQIEINVQNDSTIAGTYLLEIITSDVLETSVTIVVSPAIIILQGKEITTGSVSIPFKTYDSFQPNAEPPLQPTSLQTLTGWPSYPLIYTLTRNTAIIQNAQSTVGFNVNASFSYQTLMVIPSSSDPLYLAIYYQQKTSGEPGQTVFTGLGLANASFFPSSTAIPQASMTFTRISSNTSTLPYQG